MELHTEAWPLFIMHHVGNTQEAEQGEWDTRLLQENMHTHLVWSLE